MRAVTISKHTFRGDAKDKGNHAPEDIEGFYIILVLEINSKS